MNEFMSVREAIELALTLKRGRMLRIRLWADFYSPFGKIFVAP